MSAVLPALVLIGAATLTYFFCVRPMRRGECAMGTEAGGKRADPGSIDDLDERIRQLRREVRMMREATTAGTPGRAPNHDGRDA